MVLVFVFETRGESVVGKEEHDEQELCLKEEEKLHI